MTKRSSWCVALLLLGSLTGCTPESRYDGDRSARDAGSAPPRDGAGDAVQPDATVNEDAGPMLDADGPKASDLASDARPDDLTQGPDDAGKDGGAAPDAAPDVTADSGDGPVDISPDACRPDCQDRQCGSDGCGGECGRCPLGETCGAGVCTLDLDLRSVSGDGQQAEPDRRIEPLVVRVLSREGEPVPGVEVSFAAPLGAWVSAPRVVADIAGEARVEARLGLAIGPQVFTASAPSAAPVTFTATVRAPAAGVILTVVNAEQGGSPAVGPGPATAAAIGPVSAVVAAANGTLYLAAGEERCAVYQLDPAGVLTRIAGSGVCGFAGDGEVATTAELQDPRSLALDEEAGVLFIADSGNGRIRALDLATGVITTRAGGGRATPPAQGDGNPADAAFLGEPTGLLLGPDEALYLVSPGLPQCIRRIDPDSGIIQPVVVCEGDSTARLSPVEVGGSLAWDRDGRLLFAGRFVGTSLGAVPPAPPVFAIAKVDWLGSLQLVAGGAAGADDEEGEALAVSLSGLASLATDRGGDLFFAVAEEHRVRRVDAATGFVTTVAGQGAPGFSGDYGPAARGRLASPSALAVDAHGHLLVADVGNHAVRLIWGVAPPPLPGPAADLVQTAGALYAVTPGGSLVRLDLPGTDDPATLRHESVAWVAARGFDPIAPTVTLDGDLVVCRAGSTERLAPTTGITVDLLAGTCGRAFALGKDGTLFSTLGNKVMALEVPLRLQWTATPAAGEVRSLAVLDTGTVLALVVDDGLYGLASDTGAIRWKHACAATGGLAIGSGEQVFVSTRDGLHQIDPTSCQAELCPVVHRTALADYGTPGSAILVDEDELVLVFLEGQGLVAVEHGTILWFEPAVRQTRALLGMNRRLYLGDDAGRLTTRSTWWGATLRTDEAAPGFPVTGMSLTPDGSLWLQASPVLRRLPSLSPGGLSAGPWPKPRRDLANHASAGLREACATRCQEAAATCGADGCGGACGSCLSGDTCKAGHCRGGGCGAIPEEGCCEGDTVVSCVAGEVASFACPPGWPCGWVSSQGISGYSCGGSGADPTGEHPLACDRGCVPSCAGKECGGDGCGGTCGICAVGERCIATRCLAACGSIPDVGCCYRGSALTCRAEEGLVEEVCGVRGCGWSDQQGRAGCGLDGTPPPEIAWECDPDCVPDCLGRECGDNGCGAVCGRCAANEVCEDGLCVCVPACAGKDCGDDGCGGECGACPAGQQCVAGACACVPDCADRECGDNGCGSSCGACREGSACAAGSCVLLADCGDTHCSPEKLENCTTCPADCACGCGESCLDEGCVFTACEGRSCGDDGCGGECGVCEAGLECLDGLCACQVEVLVDAASIPGNVPRDIAGRYGEARDCRPAEVNGWGGDLSAHCFRKLDGSSWRIWNNGCGWAIGRPDPLRPDDRNAWYRAWTFMERCDRLPLIQQGVAALTTDRFYDTFGVWIPGLSSTTTCLCTPACEGKECGEDGCGATCGSCAEGLSCVGGVCQ